MAARLVNNPQEDVVELGRCSCAAGLNLTSLYEITQRLCAKKRFRDMGDMNSPVVGRRADFVNLVDKDDCFAHALSLLEEVADAACADTDKHFHEVRAGDAEKADARFASDCSGEQGLAGAGWTHEKNSFRYPCPYFVKALRHSQEVNDLGDFLFHTGVSGDVVERR